MENFDENWALKQAVIASQHSECRSKRGVVIWNRKSGTIFYGWNEIPLPFKCDGSEKCKANCSKTAVHAEQAALLRMIGNEIPANKCEMLHVKSVDGKAVFSEKPSCWQCSKLILASGINYMWLYQKEGLIRYTPEKFHKLTLINNNLIYK